MMTYRQHSAGAGNAILLAMIAAIITACEPPAPALTYDDFTIGGVPEGTDSAEIRRTFGDPDSVTTTDNPFSSESELVTWHYRGFEVRFGDGATPVGYMIHERGERTPRGLQVGDPATLARQLYGRPNVEEASGWTYVDPRDEGLYVVDLVIEADTVRRIYVGRVVQ